MLRPRTVLSMEDGTCNLADAENGYGNTDGTVCCFKNDMGDYLALGVTGSASLDVVLGRLRNTGYL